MAIAITRAVSPALQRCELTYLERQPIDAARAAAQHRDYEECLRSLGIQVVSLPAEPELPDSVFVEDPAVVVDETAVITRMGAASRRAEAESLAKALERYRPLRWMREPATLEGGDIVRVGRMLLAGLSPRTNREGIRQLADFVAPYGYSVEPVEIRDCLHLKTACCTLADGSLLVNRGWVDTSALRGFELIDVAAAEPWAADVLAIGQTILIPANYPETARLLTARGWSVQSLDVSELQKAEAGVTCMSVLLDSPDGG
jgi:dimethylargininase